VEETEAQRSGPARTLLWSFAVLTVLISAWAVLRAAVDAPHNWMPYTLIGLVVGGVSVGLAWAATLTWERMSAGLLRGVLVLMLAYHALFGVVLMAERAWKLQSSNEDLAIVLWPHIVRAIHSLE
jgi:hypothetical protein